MNELLGGIAFLRLINSWPFREKFYEAGGVERLFAEFHDDMPRELIHLKDEPT